MIEHELKTDPEPYRYIKLGLKKAEFRCNDRGFHAGDRLKLKKTTLSHAQRLTGQGGLAYTGDVLYCKVTHVQIGTGYGIPEGYAMLSIEVLEEIKANA